MDKEQRGKKVVIYQAKNGAIELRGDASRETIWATQAQIVRLFGVDQSVVSRHVKNISKDGEVEEKSNMQKCIVQLLQKIQLLGISEQFK